MMVKKFVKMLCMIVLLIAVGIAGTCMYEYINKNTTDVHTQKNNFKEENPIKPDVEYLSSIGLSSFTSNLPVIMIETNHQTMGREPIWAKIAVMNDASGKNDILGEADDVLTATIKQRGASSYNFDKPQYRIKFYKKKDGKERDYNFLGLGKNSEWVLNGPFLDKTLARNYLMYQLSKETMDWAPNTAYCEVFVDGKYQGVYLLIEPITNGSSRLRLSKFSLLSGATPFVVKRDRVGTEENVITTYGEEKGYVGGELSIDYPAKTRLTKRQQTWVENYVSNFEKALYSKGFSDADTGYAKYIDVDSFVDYYILNEFSLNHDGGVLSTYAYQELGGKMKMCVWDFNNAFNNYQWFEMDSDVFYIARNYWFDRLLTDRHFVQKVIDRYHELRNTTLSDAHIESIIASSQEQLKDAQIRNFAVWGYTFDYSMVVGHRDPASYEEAMSQLRTCIKERLEYMDNNIEELYKSCIN